MLGLTRGKEEQALPSAASEQRVPGWAALVRLRFRPLAVGAVPVPGLVARVGVVSTPPAQPACNGGQCTKPGMPGE